MSVRPQAEDASGSSEPDDRELLRDQIRNGIETFRFAMGLIVQIWTFLAAAGALLLGYSLSQRMVAPIFLAGLLPMLMFTAYWVVLRRMLSVLFPTMLAESELKMRTAPLISTYVKVHYGHLLNQFVSATKSGKKPESAVKELQSLSTVLKSDALRVLSVVTLVIWAGAILLAVIFGWPWAQ
jgi:hypothetical protein